MKKILISISMFFLSIMMFAGSWNPYLSQGIISPAPLLPVQLNGTGLLAFNIGNTGSDPITLVVGQEMKVLITLSKGRPDNINPIAAIGGSWSQYFTWSYDPVTSVYTGVQIQTIPGGPVQGELTIKYLVTENTVSGKVLNGFKAEIIPPAYMSGANTSNDDLVSSYTLTQYNPLYGIDEKDDASRLQIDSNENDIYVKDLVGKELKGKMLVYNMIGQLVGTKKLTGGTLNKFPMNVEQGYYAVEVNDKDKTYKAEIYLTR